jgi:hypothetical protein
MKGQLISANLTVTSSYKFYAMLIHFFQILSFYKAVELVGSWILDSFVVDSVVELLLEVSLWDYELELSSEMDYSDDDSSLFNFDFTYSSIVLGFCTDMLKY